MPQTTSAVLPKAQSAHEASWKRTFVDLKVAVSFIVTVDLGRQRDWGEGNEASAQEVPLHKGGQLGYRMAAPFFVAATAFFTPRGMASNTSWTSSLPPMWEPRAAVNRVLRSVHKILAATARPIALGGYRSAACVKGGDVCCFLAGKRPFSPFQFSRKCGAVLPPSRACSPARIISSSRHGAGAGFPIGAEPSAPYAPAEAVFVARSRRSRLHRRCGRPGPSWDTARAQLSFCRCVLWLLLSLWCSLKL